MGPKGLRVVASQNTSEPSALPDTNTLPFGLKALAPGGTYRAKFADQTVVFKIAPDAKTDAPLVGRLQARR